VTHDQEEAMTLGDRIVVMKDGDIHQVGTPLEVYDQPVNRFVAGFVGTPPMNFLSGRLISENGGVFWNSGANRLRIPAEKANGLVSRANPEVVLGLRPEAIGLHGEGRFAGDGSNVLSVHVNVVEPLGEKMDILAATAENLNIVVRVDAQPDIQPGMALSLHLDMRKAHVFDPAPDGRNLSLGNSPAGGSPESSRALE
jgi:multiple sugar transport system ATP-binding protein